jgi:hypothetical protein
MSMIKIKKFDRRGSFEDVGFYGGPAKEAPWFPEAAAAQASRKKAR